MAHLIYGSGQLMHNTRKRTYDTGLIIYEIVHAGVDSPIGHRMASLMNRAHRGYPIDDNDMTYVLAAFIVAPIRHITKVGWRATTSAERYAADAFFLRLGTLMNIAHIPADYEETEAFFDDYETANVAYCPEAEAMGRRLIHELKTMQPWPLRPLAPKTFTALMDEPRIADALGLPAPGPIFSAAVSATQRLRATLVPYRAPRNDPAFLPGRAVSGIYPDGYALDDLGTRHMRHPEPSTATTRTESP